MKKFIDNVKAWLRGEELETEIAVSVPVLFLIIAVIVFIIWKVVL